MNGMNKKFAIILAVVLIAGVYLYYNLTSKEADQETLSPTPSPVVTANPNIKTFSSPDLGIEFQYNFAPYEDITILVKQERNKVYVYPSNFSNYLAGQRVEVFSKETGETFEASIRRQILAGYPWPDCKIEITQISGKSNLFKAEISYPMPIDQENYNPWVNMDKCNKNYDKANGIRYFYYDSNFPDKFLYFDIGQYGIPGNEKGDIAWQDTIKLLSK